MQTSELGIHKILKGLGADMSGVASLDSLRGHGIPWEGIKDVAGGTRNIIVFGMRMVDSAIAVSQRNIRVSQFMTKCLYEELDRVAYGLCRHLDDLGYSAIPFPSYLPVPMNKDTRGFIGDMSHRAVAYEAGLGIIGKSTLLITKKFGPRVRFLSVLTDAPLTPGKKLTVDYCKNCDKCIRACPVRAIGEDRKVDVSTCGKENMKWGLPGVMKFARRLISASTEDERHALIKTPEFWEIWQNLSTGIFYYCFECLNSCPIGKKARHSS